MAAKVLFLLALVAAVAYATNDCKCDTETEEEATRVWEFFKKLSEQEDPKNELLNFVLPGELSPLLDCPCEKKEERRRKRKILPEVSEASEDVDYGTGSIGGIRRTPKCPHGYVWFGILCVDEKLMMDRK